MQQEDGELQIETFSLLNKQAAGGICRYVKVTSSHARTMGTVYNYTCLASKVWRLPHTNCVACVESPMLNVT